jgi:hypothetical protein
VVRHILFLTCALAQRVQWRGSDAIPVLSQRCDSD